MLRFSNHLRHYWPEYSLLALLLLSQIIWISLDTSPALWDLAGHSSRAVQVSQLVLHGNLRTLFHLETIYPPLTYLVTLPFFVLSRWHGDSPQWSLLLWNALAAWGLYTIAWKLYSRRDLAILSCALFFLWPLPAHFSHIFDLDFPLTAICLATLAALLSTDRFRSKRWTIIHGITIGLALLVKWTSFIYLIAPKLAYIAWSWTRTTDRRQLIRRVILSGLLGTLIALPWYAVYTSDILRSAVATRHNVFSVPYEDLTSVNNALFYIRWMIRSMTLPMLALSGLGLLLMAWRRKLGSLIILTWTIAPYLVLTFALYSKESRYFLPSMPALAIAAGFALTRLRGKMKVVAITLTLLWAGVFWVHSAWTPIIPDAVVDKLKLTRVYGVQAVKPESPYFGVTQPTQYQIGVMKDLPTAIAAVLPTLDTATINIAVVPNSIYLSGQQVQYGLRLERLEWPSGPYRFDFSPSSRVRGAGWREALADADLIITKTGDQGPLVWGPYLPEVATAEATLDPDTFGSYQLVADWQVTGIEKEPQVMRLWVRR